MGNIDKIKVKIALCYAHLTLSSLKDLPILFKLLQDIANISQKKFFKDQIFKND